MTYVKRLTLFTALLLAVGISPAEAAQGTVEFFNESAGYGYVTDNETDETYIFETADITGSVQEGDAVDFAVTTEDDRYSVKAQSVALVNAEGADSADAEAEAAAEEETATENALTEDPAEAEEAADEAAEADNADAADEDAADSADDGSE